MGCSFDGRMPYTITFEYDSRLNQYETTLFLCGKVKEICELLSHLPDDLKRWLSQLVDRKVNDLEHRMDDVERDAAYMKALAEDMKADQLQFEKRIEGLLKMWEETESAKVEKRLADQDAKIESVKAYCRALIADVNVLIMSLQKSIADMYVNGTRYTDEQIAKLRDECYDLISRENGNMIWVINPATGQSAYLYQVLSDIFMQAQLLSLTADEYDDIGLTADMYDELGLTADEYDKRGWLLLFKYKYIEPLYEYIDRKDGQYVEYLQAKIDKLERRMSNILSPVSGTYVSFEEAIEQLFNLHTDELGLTADEYDAMDLTADEYDAKNITAFNYDLYGLKKEG